MAPGIDLALIEEAADRAPRSVVRENTRQRRGGAHRVDATDREVTMRVHSIWSAAVVAFASALALTGAARADHIDGNIGTSQAPPSVLVQPTQPSVVVQPGQPAVIVQPAQPSTVVVPATQIVQAEDIEANEVRAQTVYANKIRASEVRGAIHQTAKVKLDNAADIKAPTVVGAVIYADTIKAHAVIADHIYVRELDRR
jgi:hypothetical protein